MSFQDINQNNITNDFMKFDIESEDVTGPCDLFSQEVNYSKTNSYDSWFKNIIITQNHEFREQNKMFEPQYSIQFQIKYHQEVEFQQINQITQTQNEIEDNCQQSQESEIVQSQEIVKQQTIQEQQENVSSQKIKDKQNKRQKKQQTDLIQNEENLATRNCCRLFKDFFNQKKYQNYKNAFKKYKISPKIYYEDFCKKYFPSNEVRIKNIQEMNRLKQGDTFYEETNFFKTLIINNYPQIVIAIFSKKNQYTSKQKEFQMNWINNFLFNHIYLSYSPQQ